MKLWLWLPRVCQPIKMRSQAPKLQDLELSPTQTFPVGYLQTGAYWFSVAPSSPWWQWWSSSLHHLPSARHTPGLQNTLQYFGTPLLQRMPHAQGGQNEWQDLVGSPRKLFFLIPSACYEVFSSLSSLSFVHSTYAANTWNIYLYLPSERQG